MFLDDLLAFQNPEIVAVALGLLTFLFSYTVLSKFMENKSAILVSIPIGAIVGFFVFREEFMLGRGALSILLLIVGLAVVFKIMQSFYKAGRHQFR